MTGPDYCACMWDNSWVPLKFPTNQWENPYADCRAYEVCTSGGKHPESALNNLFNRKLQSGEKREKWTRRIHPEDVCPLPAQHECRALADPRQRQGRAFPLGPISFIFMQSSGKNCPNNRLAPPLWEILDPPLITANSRCLTSCCRGG